MHRHRPFGPGFRGRGFGPRPFFFRRPHFFRPMGCGGILLLPFFFFAFMLFTALLRFIF